MADGVTTQTTALATIPTSTKIATDDAGSPGHVQLVKLAVPTDGSATALGDATAGLPVDPTARTLRVSPASGPTISTSAYTAKDALGALLEFQNINRASGRSVFIQSVTLVDRDQERVAIDLVLFKASITAPTDNAIFDPTDSELADCVGVIPFTAGSWYDFNDNSVASVNVGLEVAVTGTSLYGVLVLRGAPTYTATTDIQGPYLTVIQS